MKAEHGDADDLLAAGIRPRERILIIGPVLPYRGGIAQHTTMLHRALREQSECLTISFSRQYPRWLFPGKSDKDENLTGHVEEGVEFIIDSVNPLTWYRALSLAKRFSPRLVVFPWWHVYWTPCFAWFGRKFRREGFEIVFLCHNSVEHEDARWKSLLSDLALSYANRFVVHTAVDKNNLLARFPDRPINVHPLPVFDHFPQPSVVLPRRAKLELLFFGFVRPYKGLDVLLAAMTRLKNEDVFLSIVGEFWNGEHETLKFIGDYEIADQIEVVARYVSDDEAAAYFERCDVVILPYHSATGSAVIPLAYHYGKPVIATRVGGMPDVVKDGKTGTLIEPGSSIELAGAIKDLLTKAILCDADEISKIKDRMTWSGLAEAVIGLTPKDANTYPQTYSEPQRTHAILDMRSREHKAKKIATLVGRNGKTSFCKVLEIGTGSGFIAAYFSQLNAVEVHAVDIADERQINEGFQFQRVEGTTLPFADETFDLVISNHVVEHVGNSLEQAHHLSEIFRCLQHGGLLYFAVPNRWRLFEPHYKLPMLSWFPDKFASVCVRLFNRGSHYDCKPLSQREAVDLLNRSGFDCVDVTLDAIPLTGVLEGGWLTRQITGLPKAFWRLFSPIMPTLIFVCRKPSL